MQPTRLKERMCELKTNLSTISEEQNQPVPPSPSPTMEPTHPSGSMAASRATTMQPTPTSASPATAVQATIDKSMEVNGDVIGSESLYIDGKVKGTINLPGSRVTIGRNGRVSGNISAREVVVLGEVRGDINASERVDLRSEGSLTGDVIAQHIIIGDGAFFKGIVDIQKLGQGNDGMAAGGISSTESQKAVSAKA
jgi:cytoskeletal protein CcmA (bactofilin family)